MARLFLTLIASLVYSSALIAQAFTSSCYHGHNTVTSKSRTTNTAVEQAPCSRHRTRRSVALFAAKKSKKSSKNSNKSTIGKRTQSASGFGGAAVQPCPCGSGSGYMKCCGVLHNDEDKFGAAAAEAVVRARYSAYAKREVDFIIASTHPLNEANFMADIEHWRETIRTNCYDNFELTSCKIMSEEYEGEGAEEQAIVKFEATMIQVDSREKVSFVETSTFKRAGKHIRRGAWLYFSGVIEPAEGAPPPIDMDDVNQDEAIADEGKEVVVAEALDVTKS
mmetsp:Transcript_26916/g.41728  ORF Transcript_26916/g.41728 Transcript_26916/m.41728 type:complete len:279 (-) Transcript_26916:40-876(-)